MFVLNSQIMIRYSPSQPGTIFDWKVQRRIYDLNDQNGNPATFIVYDHNLWWKSNPTKACERKNESSNLTILFRYRYQAAIICLVYRNYGFCNSVWIYGLQTETIKMKKYFTSCGKCWLGISLIRSSIKIKLRDSSGYFSTLVLNHVFCWLNIVWYKACHLVQHPFAPNSKFQKVPSFQCVANLIIWIFYVIKIWIKAHCGLEVSEYEGLEIRHNR